MTGQRESAKVAGEWLFKAGRDLNPYAISSRYPGGWDPETAADAVRAISIAAKTRGFVEKRLS